MSYSTAEDVRLILESVEEKNQSAADLSDPKVNANIANADAQINGRLSIRYAVPFEEPIPKLIQSLSADIAAYLCDLNYRISKEYASQLNPIYLRYQRATQMLEWLATAKASIPDDGLPDDGVSSGATVYNPYYGDLLSEEHVFTPPKWR